MVERITFGQQYSVGHPVLDHQHRNIYQMFVRLADAIDSNELAICGQFLDDLAMAFQDHFALEEVVMEAAGFRAVDDHRQLHVHYLRRIEALRGNIPTDRSALEQCYESLLHVFLDDVLDADFAFAPTLGRPASKESAA
jgi:hemerythrin